MSIRPAYNPPIIPARFGGTGYNMVQDLSFPDSAVLYGDGSAAKLQFLSTVAGGFPTVLRRGAAGLVKNRRSGRVRVLHNTVSTQVSSTANIDIVSLAVAKRNPNSRIIVMASVSVGKGDFPELGGQVAIQIQRDATTIFNTGSMICRNTTGLASPNNTRVGSFSTVNLVYEDTTSPASTTSATYRIRSIPNGSVTSFIYQWGGAPSSITVFEIIPNNGAG